MKFLEIVELDGVKSKMSQNKYDDILIYNTFCGYSILAICDDSVEDLKLGQPFLCSKYGNQIQFATQRDIDSFKYWLQEDYSVCKIVALSNISTDIYEDFKLLPTIHIKDIYNAINYYNNNNGNLPHITHIDVNENGFVTFQIFDDNENVIEDMDQYTYDKAKLAFEESENIKYDYNNENHMLVVSAIQLGIKYALNNLK